MVTKSALRSFLGRPAATNADFAALYRSELPRIYNYFRYRVGDGPLAEDLTSETFEKAWRSRHRYRHDLASFSTWLFSIARNVAVDHYRRSQHEVALQHAEQLAGDEMTEATVAKQEQLARLAELLAQCSDRERELVALKYGAGLTNRQIAPMMKMSESNVAVTLHRLVRRLRLEWGNEP
jgi:RNA polymerase sigma-70 factor, ECF subfamily